ncbi:MAG TPA: hypothetical protein VFC54_02175 [Pseudolabrys sp.]|nr:hypothetical protein [Pseudolabrys sp.]
MPLIRTGAAVLIMLLSSASGWAQADKSNPAPSGGLFTGTAEEQAACSPDAVEFCRDDIPATFAVLACLQAHREKLKKACQEVLKSHGE